jgi:hypothetical protein
MKNETMLHEEIQGELEELSKLEVGSEKYKVAVDGVAKLMDRAIEIDKINADTQEKVESREAEIDLKLKQLEEDKKDRKVRNGIAIAGIGIPAVVSIWGTLKTLKFEEVGTVTTLAGREHLRKIFNLFKK